MTNLADEIADDIRAINAGSQLSRDGLGTLVMRTLYDKGIIRLDQVREVGRFIADNANDLPSVLAASLVREFQLGDVR